jgi:beta-glucosidase
MVHFNVFQVSDGPNGIRGNHFLMGTPAKCIPVSCQHTHLSYVSLIFVQCSTALGATWDTKLVEEVGLKLLAEDAKLRAASLVLAPTCNIQRVSCKFTTVNINLNLYRTLLEDE